MQTLESNDQDYIQKYKKIHDDIYSHFSTCDFAKSNLSDTWTHTLEQKGRNFSIEEMLSMHALGSRVNSWIDDCNYLIDLSCVLPTDEVTNKLLEIGEPDFGTPRKDIHFNGKYYSSNFIHHVLIAVKIIHSIQEQKITHPKVLEIGGGVGGIEYLLKSYFAEKITYYAVDIPETLLIQEWYLRNCFPKTPTSFKGNAQEASFAEGGLNFINAYVLDSQKITFNVAINIDSMQEMDASTVSFYINYIENNLETGGIFFCQNHYGQSSKGLKEPTEYVHSPLWKVVQAELAPQIECCTESEQFRLIYVKEKNDHSSELRRVSLRLLWNLYLSSHIQNSHELVPEILNIANNEKSISQGIVSLQEILKKHLPDFSQDISELKHNIFWPQKSFLSQCNLRSYSWLKKAPDRENFSSHIWRFHFQLLQLMEKTQNVSSAEIPQIELKRKELVQSLISEVEKHHLTEYWIAYFLGITCALKEDKLTSNISEKFGKQITSPFWLVRLASLFHRFGNTGEALEYLSQIPTDDKLDYFVLIQCLETYYLLGNKDKARNLFQLQKKEESNIVVNTTRLKAAALLGEWSEIEKNLRLNSQIFGGSKTLDILEIYYRYHQNDEIKHWILNLLTNNFLNQEAAPEMKLRLGLFLLKLGDERGHELIEENLKKISHHYYPLSYAGKLLLGAGNEELAKWALSESARLRPNTFLHYDFIGSVFFSNKKYTEAKVYFQKALEIKPYLRHFQAKNLFCSFVPEIREKEIFGRSENLELIFQRKQDFYARLGPANK